MIKSNINEGIEISGTVIDILAETSSLLRALKEFLANKLGEEEAAFWYAKIIKVAEMTDIEIMEETNLMLNELHNMLAEKGWQTSCLQHKGNLEKGRIIMVSKRKEQRNDTDNH